MLTEERYKIILKSVNEKKTVTAIELVNLLKTSESTVRRDLSVLSKMGKLKKVHGGAVAIDAEIMMNEPEVAEKINLNSELKEQIARYAAQTIRKNDFIFIDAGTTTAKMIEYITEKNATFITNGFKHAHLLAMRGFKVYLTGGQVKASTEAIVGVNCIDFLNKYNFTKCFLGANGISVQNGLTTHDVDESTVKHTAAKRSYVTYVLADHTKFNKTAAVSFGDIEKVCIITDKLIDEDYRSITVIKEVCE